MPSPPIVTFVNPLTDHLDEMLERSMCVLVQIRQLREEAKSGKKLEGWAIRNLQADARGLHRKAGGL